MFGGDVHETTKLSADVLLFKPYEVVWLLSWVSPNGSVIVISIDLLVLFPAELVTLYVRVVIQPANFCCE